MKEERGAPVAESPTRSPKRMGSPTKGLVTADDAVADQFYQEMARFYKRPPKHESPTRRLRQQIECAFTQKGFLAQQPEY